MTTAYALAGLPGAGKSTVREIGVELTEGDEILAGEMIREWFEDDHGREPESSELGDYAAEQRDELGSAFFAEKVVGELLRGEREVDGPVWLDSVRHLDSVVEFSEHFTNCYLIYVTAPFGTRLSRLQTRGRDGEDDFEPLDLLERDEHELTELGTGTIVGNDRIDYIIENDGTYEDLNEAVESIIND
jgi:dephospho-CoA kinase